MGLRLVRRALIQPTGIAQGAHPLALLLHGFQLRVLLSRNPGPSFLPATASPEGPRQGFSMGVMVLGERSRSDVILIFHSCPTIGHLTAFSPEARLTHSIIRAMVRA